jgi:ketosteroid isomerase-like protein
MTENPLRVVRAAYQAYVDKDRHKIESLLANDFHFTSPIDNSLDREAYLRICWPNSSQTEKFDYIHQFADGAHAFIVYELTAKSGKRFCNSEVITVRNGKLANVEVFFGWNLPHDVPTGHHRDPETSSASDQRREQTGEDCT